MKYTRGFFLEGKYPYVRYGSGSQKIVIFPPTQELIFSIAQNPEKQLKNYVKMLSPLEDFSLYILGYDKTISEKQWCRDVAKDFAIFIKDLGPVVIVGISYGGAIAIPFAEQNPELTKKLLLIVSAYGLSDDGVDFCKDFIRLAKTKGFREVQRKMDNLSNKWWIRTLLNITTTLQWHTRKQSINPASTFINAYTHISTYPVGLKRHLKGIKAPTLILGGTQDQFFSKERYQETAALIPNATLELYEGRSHVLPLECYKTIQKRATKFLMEK
ncbi:alpha/beta fold hydrolase [Candidatus Lokiarchaeum ossiferum]|uniref:alpha/beta fold hydrolase n=1 Tax=Candidatus Lokiarchaeum ossiferum TaxID=2951803 RepID=UPI00352BF027